MTISWFDLSKSLEAMSNRKLAFKLKAMFFAAFTFYFLEWLLTMGTVIQAICPGALWSLGVTHYAIKVIVSYSYCVRTDIALYSTKKYTSKSKWAVWILQALILLTALVNVLKVFLTYSSKVNAETGACDFAIGGFWGYVDEIMFGTIDFATIVMIVYFYFDQNLKGQIGYIIFRIIMMSSATFVVTLIALVINITIPSVGLTVSIMDITADILTMMRVYTKPNMNVKWGGKASILNLKTANGGMDGMANKAKAETDDYDTRHPNGTTTGDSIALQDMTSDGNETECNRLA